MTRSYPALLLPVLLPLPMVAACVAGPNPMARPMANPVPLVAPPTSFSSDRISVTVRGSGPDVILIPGLSSSPEIWESTIAALPGYRYHLVHVAGFAAMPAAGNANGPVIAPVAEEIARYISEAGLDRPAIVGHSLGGTWGTILAARHPTLVSRLMVVDMLPFIGAMFGGPNASPESLQPVAEQIRQAISSGSGETSRTMTEQTIAGMVATEALRPIAVRHSLDSDAAVSGQAMYELITTDLRPELPKIRVPVTVLWVRPPEAPLTDEQMKQFYRLSYTGVPGARIVHIADSRHFIMWDAPDAFRRELRDFLAQPSN